MGEDTSEVRARIEQARGRLGADVEALAYQANLPKRLRERLRTRVAETRARLQNDPRTQAMQAGIADIRQGHRRDGARKIAEAAKQPAALGLLIGAAGLAASRAADRSHDEPSLGDRLRRSNGSSPDGDHHMRPADLMGLMSRPAMTATVHMRQAKKSGRAPGAKQFAGYVAVGVATTALTKWANDRIDRTAPPAAGR
jgi:hypothetical protein